MRSICRLLSAVLLLLVADSALAQETLSQAYQSASSLTPPMSDYSVAYLSQIFGTVGNVLQGSSGQILGKMFDVFNKGILVVAALWLGYSVITMVVQAAISGSLASQGGKSTGFVMLRIAFGFALIIPSSSTGYSLLQDIFMKVVVQGVGLADNVWDKALDYLQYGGNLFIPPSTLNNDHDMITNAIGTVAPQPSPAPSVTYYTTGLSSSTPSGYVGQIFVDEVCMLAIPASNSSFGAGASSVAPVFTPPSLTAATTTGGTPTVNSGSISFPGSTTNTDCGEVTPYAFSISGASTDENIKLAQTSYQAMKQAVLSTMPAAEAYVNATYPLSGTAYADSVKVSTMVAPVSGSSEYTCPTCTSSASNSCSLACSMVNNNSKAVFAAIIGYANLIAPDQVLAQSRNGQTGFMNSAREQGWIMAGGYYWNVEAANSVSSNLNISKLGPTFTAPSVGSSGNVPQAIQQVMVTAASDVTSYTPILSTLWSQYVGAEQNTSGSGSTTTDELGGVGHLIGELESKIATALIQAPGGGSGNYNPISVLMSSGNALLDIVGVMWIAAIALSVGIAVAAGICNSTSPGGVILQAGLTWVKSIIMLLTTMLLLPGCVMAYYVPLYPYTVFTFASVGWIAMVIEGMAAAPLVCIGLTHPEGHDFLGKAEQALMLFLGIFVRPALMVIGLIAAMIVSFVAFGMLNTGFGMLMKALEGHGAFGNPFPIVIMISICMIMVIYAFMIMELIEQCFKLIYQLPNAILKWIGGPQTGDEYGQMAAQLKGAVSSGASSGKEFMQGSDKANMEMADSIRKAKAQEDKNNKPGGTGIDSDD